MFYGRAALDSVKIPEPIYLKIKTAVTAPIAGFEHKKNYDGTHYTKEQQLQATHQQVLFLVKNHYAKGACEEELEKIINYFTKNK